MQQLSVTQVTDDISQWEHIRPKCTAFDQSLTAVYRYHRNAPTYTSAAVP